MSEEQKKKSLSLNVLPDQQRMAKFTPPDPSGDEEPAQLLPPADWPIARKLLHGKVIAALKQIYDPEIPVDIYELGLIYNIDISADNEVSIRMTLTAPGCPVAGELVQQVESGIEAIDEVKEGKVELVWDPPWGPARMSEAARLHLGL